MDNRVIDNIVLSYLIMRIRSGALSYSEVISAYPQYKPYIDAVAEIESEE